MSDDERLIQEGCLAYLRLRASGQIISVHQFPSGEWRVKFRDFSTTKQDAMFATEAEARKEFSRVRYQDLSMLVGTMTEEERLIAARFWLDVLSGKFFGKGETK